MLILCIMFPSKQPSCLNNQLVYVDCKKGTMVQVDSSQRMLRIADPDSRYSGFYSMQKQSNLQADNFYQTVWKTATLTKTLRRNKGWVCYSNKIRIMHLLSGLYWICDFMYSSKTLLGLTLIPAVCQNKHSHFWPSVFLEPKF